MTGRRNAAVVAIILLVTILLGIAGVTARQRAEAKRASSSDVAPVDRGVAVAVAVAQRRTLALDVSASGFLEPFEELTISAQVPGYVEQQFVEVGDTIVAGDPLCQLDESIRRVAVDKAKAAAERAASELKLAEEQVKRIERLRVQESANPTEILQVETNLAVAQAMRKQADAAVTEAVILRGKTTVRSPITGSVSRIHTRRGEYAYVGQPLVDVIERDRLKLTVQLNDREVVAFAIGDPVTMKVAAWPQRSFAGLILRIHPRATLDSRKFEVEIEVPNPDHVLRPGFYARADLKRQDDGANGSVEAVVIPRMAVFELYRQQFCYVVRRSDGESVLRAHRTAIDTAPVLSDMQWVQVFRGVTPGDRVVTTGLQHVADQCVVRVMED